MFQRAGLFVCAVLGASMLLDSCSPELTHPPGHDAAHTAMIRFDVPQGDLGAAVLRFGEQAGVCLAFDPEMTRGKTTQGLSGTYAVSVALRMLVKDSGVNVVLLSGSRYRLEPSGSAL